MTDGHSGLRVVRSEMLCLIPVGSGAPRSIPDNMLTIRVRRRPKYVLVTVTGEIDIATVGAGRDGPGDGLPAAAAQSRHSEAEAPIKRIYD